MELKANTVSEKIDVIGYNQLTIIIIKGCLSVKGYFVNGGDFTTETVCDNIPYYFDISRYFEIEFISVTDCEFTFSLE